jgi:hypothetical protein
MRLLVLLVEEVVFGGGGLSTDPSVGVTLGNVCRRSVS